MILFTSFSVLQNAIHVSNTAVTSVSSSTRSLSVAHSDLLVPTLQLHLIRKCVSDQAVINAFVTCRLDTANAFYMVSLPPIHNTFSLYST